MTDDIARTILVVGMAVFVPIGAYHRVKAGTGERLDRKQEGWPILLTLRPLGLAFMVCLVAFIVQPAWLKWAAVALPDWLRWAGVPFGIAAGLLLTWTLRSLGRNLTDTVVTRQTATLVTHGPYRWVRHPLYVTVALAVIANTLITANALLAVIGIGGLSAIVVRTATEEKNLVVRFGDEYRDYMRHTGRFVPRWPW
jgi:protein-S-isoprenylcysteine O-methyltransferase Ste14